MRVKTIDTKSLVNETGKTVKELCEDLDLNYFSFLNANAQNKISNKTLKLIEDVYKVEFVYSDELDKMYCYNSLITGTIDCEDKIEIDSYIRIKEYGEIRQVVDIVQKYGEQWYITDTPFRYRYQDKLTDMCHLGMIKKAAPNVEDLLTDEDWRDSNGYVITEEKAKYERYKV